MLIAKFNGSPIIAQQKVIGVLNLLGAGLPAGARAFKEHLHQRGKILGASAWISPADSAVDRFVENVWCCLPGPGPTRLRARARNRDRLENRSHVVPKTEFQDGGGWTRIFTHKITIFGLVYDMIYQFLGMEAKNYKFGVFCQQCHPSVASGDADIRPRNASRIHTCHLFTS